MDDEKLIEMVSRYEFLYNLRHPKYMDNVKKEIAWKEIGEQVRQSAAACKQRWQCLRDAYRRVLNKKKGKSGQATKHMKLWKYEKEMAFLVPYFMKRVIQDSVEVTSEDEMSDNAYENYAIESNASEKSNTDIEYDDIPADVSDVRSNEPQQKIYKPNAVKRKVNLSESSPSTTLMAKLLEQNKLETPRGHDELDRFFLSISDTVKKFPPYEQALAKNKIFSLVSEMELQQLAPPSSPAYAFKTSPQ